MSKKQTRRRSSEDIEDVHPTDQPPQEHAPEELEVLRLLIHLPDSMAIISGYIEPKHFRSESCRALYKLMIEHANEGGIDFMAVLPPSAVEERRVIAMLSAENRFTGTEFNMDRAAQELIMAIRRKDIVTRRRNLENKRRTASENEAKALDEEITELTLNQHTLRSGWEKAKWMLEIHRILPDG